MHKIVSNETVTRLIVTRLLAIGCLCFALPSQAAITIGNPASPSTLPQELQNAYNAGERQITIAPGTYNLPEYNNTVFTLTNWSNTTLSAYGVTIINAEKQNTNNTHRLFTFDNCDNVTLKGANLTNITPTTYQGVVTAMGAESGGTYADWQPCAGYPVPASPPAALDCNFVDGSTVATSTPMLRLRGGDFFARPQDALGGNTFRVHLNTTTPQFVVGDYLVARLGAPFKIYLSRSRNCTIQDVTLSRNGFSPIFENGIGGGGNHILGCKWTTGAMPPGATVKPLVSGSADGFHSGYANPGPDIENCIFEGIILDDNIAIHGSFAPITASSGNTFTYATNGGVVNPAVGDQVRISNPNGYFVEANITAITPNGTDSIVTLDQTLTIPAASKFSLPRLDGAGFRILNNQIRGTRSRGILVKGDNGLIRGNTIENCGMSAVSMGPEYYWNEADYVKGVRVENNVIRNNGRMGYGGAAVWVHGDGSKGNRTIAVQNNKFSGNYNLDLDLNWLDDIKVTYNTFANSNSVSWGSTTIVNLANANNVFLLGNLVSNQFPTGTSLTIVGANVTNLTNNNPTGIRKDWLTLGVYKLIHYGTSQVLHVPGGVSTAGTAVIQTAEDGSAAQHWVFTDLSTGYYKLTHQTTNQALEGAANGLDVVQNTDNGSNYQQWTLTPYSNGSVKLTNRATGKCLNVPGNSSSSNVTLNQAADDGTNAQRWMTYLVAPTPSSNFVKNPSFEENGAFTFTPNFWTASPQDNTSYTQSGSSAIDGTYQLVQYKTAAFANTTSQVVTGLGTTGYYTLGAWVLTSGGFSQSFMYARGFNTANTTLQTNVPQTAGSWTHILIPNIAVTNGNCEIGFTSNTGSAGKFVYIDQVELFKQ